MQIWLIVLFETIFIVSMIPAMGLAKMPSFLKKKTVTKGSPWGYYEGCAPKPDP